MENSHSLYWVFSHINWANPTNVESSPYALKALLCNWWQDFFSGVLSPLCCSSQTAQQPQGPFQELNLYSDVFNHRARLQPPTLEKLSAAWAPRALPVAGQCQQQGWHVLLCTKKWGLCIWTTHSNSTGSLSSISYFPSQSTNKCKFYSSTFLLLSCFLVLIQVFLLVCPCFFF